MTEFETTKDFYYLYVRIDFLLFIRSSGHRSFETFLHNGSTSLEWIIL